MCGGKAYKVKNYIFTDVAIMNCLMRIVFFNILLFFGFYLFSDTTIGSAVKTESGDPHLNVSKVSYIQYAI